MSNKIRIYEGDRISGDIRFFLEKAGGRRHCGVRSWRHYVLEQGYLGW